VRVQRKIIICLKYQKVTFDIYRHFRWPADAFCYAMMADVHEHERMYVFTFAFRERRHLLPHLLSQNVD
jgi:hypothetical protein